MVWLRYELWKYPDGLSHRLASKAETDRLTSATPDGELLNIFYAPSPAAAEAQYCALRGIGPYIVNPADSEEPFTIAQLESQLADFPHDERLARQPALLTLTDDARDLGDAGDAGDALTPAAVPEALKAEDHGATVPSQAIEPGDHEDAHAHEEHGPTDVDPVQGDLDAAVPHAPEDHPGAENDDEPEAAPNLVEPVVQGEPETAPDMTAESARTDGLGPITMVRPSAAVRKQQRRQAGGFVGFVRLVIRLVMLAIVLAAVVIGVGIATGNLDAQTLLAQAGDLPGQVRENSMVRSLFP